jgi:signal transduction histidine kinase/ActR/RegA family two-component response regulator
MLINRARTFYERTGGLRDNGIAGYGFALATVALAMLARFLLAGQLGGFPYLTFIPAILLASFICGWRAGALAAVVGGIVHWYFQAPETPAAAVGFAPPNVLGFSMYAFAVIVILTLVGIMHLAFRDFTQSEKERKALNAELETRVRERTLALEAANQRLRDEAASRAAIEAQLRQMQKMEAVGQLTGGIAHDFNNMLAIVVGSLDIARRHLGGDSEKAERFITNAMEGAQRGAQLTSRLLAFSRQQALDPRPIDTNQLVREMSELLQRTIGENIRLATVLADGLWTTFADPLQLESAVINLCANSRDAMPDGGSLTLETSNVHLDEAYARINVDAHPGEYVAFAVADTGSGMSAEVLTRAFDPFYTTKTTGKGTGLGLSQVYGFVKQSGGHVKIESEPGRGTTVRFYLPRYLGADQAVTAAPRDAQPSIGNREAILVVEDEERVRHMTVEALNHLGYLVVSAAGPEQALDLLAGGTAPHLLLTDVVMPAMNGRVRADRVRALRPGIRVLYTSAYALHAGIQDGTLDRGAAFLAKPFTVDQLAAKIRSTLDAPFETPAAH